MIVPILTNIVFAGPALLRSFLTIVIVSTITTRLSVTITVGIMASSTIVFLFRFLKLSSHVEHPPILVCGIPRSPQKEKNMPTATKNTPKQFSIP